MHGPDPVAIGTDPAGLRNLLDLVVQDRFPQLPEDHHCIFEQQPEPLRVRASKRAGQTPEMMPLRGSVLEGCINNNQRVCSTSPLNEPSAQADTPKFCPLLSVATFSVVLRVPAGEGRKACKLQLYGRVSRVGCCVSISSRALSEVSAVEL